MSYCHANYYTCDLQIKVYFIDTKTFRQNGKASKIQSQASFVHGLLYIDTTQKSTMLCSVDKVDLNLNLTSINMVDRSKTHN